jgi:hypothetical protein
MSNSVNVVGSIFGARRRAAPPPTRSGTSPGRTPRKTPPLGRREQQQDALDKLNRELTAQSQATPLPTPNSDEVLTARRRSIAAQIARRGRASTILTQQGNTDTLGV